MAHKCVQCAGTQGDLEFVCLYTGTLKTECASTIRQSNLHSLDSVPLYRHTHQNQSLSQDVGANLSIHLCAGIEAQ
jgi:hypothetical protein